MDHCRSSASPPTQAQSLRFLCFLGVKPFLPSWCRTRLGVSAPWREAIPPWEPHFDPEIARFHRKIALLLFGSAILDRCFTIPDRSIAILHQGNAILDRRSTILDRRSTILDCGITILDRGIAILAHSDAILGQGITPLGRRIAILQRNDAIPSPGGALPDLSGTRDVRQIRILIPTTDRYRIFHPKFAQNTKPPDRLSGNRLCVLCDLGVKAHFEKQSVSQEGSCRPGPDRSAADHEAGGGRTTPGLAPAAASCAVAKRPSIRSAAPIRSDQGDEALIRMQWL